MKPFEPPWAAYADEAPVQLLEHRWSRRRRIKLQFSQKSVRSRRAAFDKLQFSFHLPSVAHVPSDQNRIRVRVTKYGGHKLDLPCKINHRPMTQMTDHRIRQQLDVHRLPWSVVEVGVQGKQPSVFVPALGHPF